MCFPNLLSLNTIKNVQNKPTHQNNLVFDYKTTTAVVIWIGRVVATNINVRILFTYTVTNTVSLLLTYF